MPVTIETGRGKGAHGLRIGLVNNMPDSALGQTERQFLSLLRGASRHHDVHLELYSLPAVPRQAAARQWLGERYQSVEVLLSGLASLDGLIVTGAEPRMPHLTQEPYWDELTSLLRWAEENTLSTVWSCLAAHAAVLSQDGIERIRQADKVFGLLDCHPAASHVLLAGLPAALSMPHSRWNDLSEAQLSTCGYSVLTRTEQGQVDLFIRQQRSLFVYFQGHPEYESDTLLREYRRDVARFLASETDRKPSLPLHCCDGSLDEEAASELARLLAEDRLAEVAKLVGRLRPQHTWHPAAVAIYRDWLELIADAKVSRAATGHVQAIPTLAESLGQVPFIPE